jgi:formyltetrahydrofolate synthetase
VLIATREGAGDFVSPELVRALGRLGSAVTSPEQLAGRAYALAGVAGAAPGSAAETIAPDDAYLEISGDFRALAAAFDRLSIK